MNILFHQIPLVNEFFIFIMHNGQPEFKVKGDV